MKKLKRLYPYQRDACNSAVRAFQKGLKKILICLPTGAGKTFATVKLIDGLIKAFAQQGTKANVLWVQHRDALVDQAEKEFKDSAPDLRVTKWTASQKNATGDVVLAMILSTRTLRDSFTIVVVDEAHHLAAEDLDAGYHGNMYTKLLKRINWGYMIGLTATPIRLDGKQLDFEEVAYSIRFLDLVRERRLARPIYMEVLTEDAYMMATAQGDFTKKALRKLDNPVRNGKITDIYLRNIQRFGKTLMFVTGVEHCYHMRDMILKKHPGAAVAVLTGKDRKDYREDVLEWFRDGPPTQQKLLINCEIFTEGFDAPSCKSVILARPTMSKGLWMQMVGRGARILQQEFPVYEHDFKVVETVGSNEVKKFEFTNGGTYYGDDLGPIREDEEGKLHMLRLQMDDEFYLVNIMDDITKFAALCQEWELEVRDLTDEEIEELETTQIMREKKMKIQELEDQNKVQQKKGGDWGKLGDEQIRDLIGILTVSTFYHHEIGFAIDPDRAAALHRLREFASKCYERKQIRVPVFGPEGQRVEIKEDWIFNRDRFSLAYGHCCIKGEFPFRYFERIRWAYYFRFVLHRDRVRSSTDNKWYRTWNYYPIVDIAPASREKHIAQVKREMEEAQRDNEEFNETYGSKRKARKLLRKIIARAKQIAAEDDEGKKRKLSSASVRRMERIATIAACKDRRLSLATTAVITTGYQLAENGRVAEMFTQAMEEILDDPACVVKITPKEVQIDRKGRGARVEEAVYGDQQQPKP